MDDALSRVAQIEQTNALGASVPPERVDHPSDVAGNFAATRRRIMVDHTKCQVGRRHRHAATLQFGKGVMRPFMHEMPVNP